MDSDVRVLWGALQALVHTVEESGLHRSGCPYAEHDEDDLPEDAECECFDPALTEALKALAATGGRARQREANK